MAHLRLTHCGTAMLVILGQSAVALAVDCYVDSQNGIDTNSGLTDALPVKTQPKIPSSCTVVYYKRGSVFNEAVRISGNAKTFTNYGNASDPLPQFVVPHTANSGSLVSSFSGGITVNGLYLAGSHGDGTSANMAKGICVMLASNNNLENCEISNCDIGIMLSGTGNEILNNYVHDLTMAVDAAVDAGVNINSVGGAEGIFINGSNNEVAYNQFVNCQAQASWDNSYDGGATEVAIQSGTISGLKVHHNFSYNSCGFFEASSSTQGTFADSEFYYNVSIDSGWMMLLQINNTTFSNIRWENNTIVQHKGAINAGLAGNITVIYNGSGTNGSGSTTGGSGTMSPTGVYFNNNLVILDGVSSYGSVIDSSINQSNNLVTTTDPGVVNWAGTTATDFDLVAGSAAINAGMTIAGLTLDYLNRTVPDPSGITDIGAFEYNSTAAAGSSSTGGAPAATGGTPLTGGTPSATGGAPGAGGSAVTATGGAVGAGGVASGTGGVMATGGANNVTTGGTTTAAATGGGTGVLGTGGGLAAGGSLATGGALAAQGGTLSGAGGQTAAVGGSSSGAIGGAPVAGASGNPVGSSENNGSCSCSVVGRQSRTTSAVLIALLALGLRRRTRKPGRRI